MYFKKKKLKPKKNVILFVSKRWVVGRLGNSLVFPWSIVSTGHAMLMACEFHAVGFTRVVLPCSVGSDWSIFVGL